MAIDYVRNIISSGYNLAKINDNFVKIQEALQDGLSRSGNGPNQMDADLDMNSNDILNVTNIVADSLTVSGMNTADILNEAAEARDFAAAWASAPSSDTIDDGVNPVGKSSYHWSQVALGAATGALPDNSVSTSKIVDEAVTEAKIANGAITEAKLAPAVRDQIAGPFATKALAESYSPTTAPGFLRLEGFSAPGDLGGALYKLVASEPSHAGKISITLSDGVTVVWYEIAEAEIHPEQFGAVGDGSTDDYAALQASFTVANHISLPWRLKGKTYVSSAAITAVATSTSIQGEWGKSKIIFTNAASAGLSITGLNPTVNPVEGHQVSIKGISLIAGVANCGLALEVEWLNNGSALRYADIENVTFDSTENGTTYWTRFADFTKIFNATVRNLFGIGDGSYRVLSGVRFLDQSISVDCSRIDFWGIDEAVYIAPTCEGIMLENPILYNVNHGVISSGAIATTVRGGHVAPLTRGIEFINTQQSNIDGMIIYLNGGATGVLLDTSNHNTISNNIFVDPEGEPGDIAVALVRDQALGTCLGNVIANNTISEVESAFYLHSAETRANNIHGNVTYNVTNMVVRGVAGVGENFIKDNTRNDSGNMTTLLTTGTLAPSVGAGMSGIYLTNNASAQTINTFSDGYVGQRVSIVANDSNTTFAHGVGLLLSGSVNYTPTAGKVIQFQREAATWREIGRT